MRVLARSTLAGYVRHRAPSQDRKALESRLSAWFAELHRAAFATPAELKAQFGNASIVSAERVVFNIKGNDYRLVAAVDYARQSLYVKWIGTHKEYDEIDVKTVEYQEDAMTIRPIRTKDDHATALKRIEAIWGAEQGSSSGDELDILTTLVDAYEAVQFPILPPSAAAAIEFRMEQQGLTRKDLEPLIGSRARVSEILSGKRALTLPMIRRVHAALQIPVDILVGTGSPTSRHEKRPKRSATPSRTVRAQAPRRKPAPRQAAAPVVRSRSRAA